MLEDPIQLPDEFTISKDEGNLRFCILHHDKVISECHAVFNVNDLVEVGIETDEQHWRQGLGFAVSKAFIEYCLLVNLEPIWACYDERIASRALAEKLGYEEYANHEAIVIGE